MQWVLYNESINGDPGIGNLNDLSASGVELAQLSHSTQSLLKRVSKEPELRKRVDEIFSMYDKDGDGLLTKGETMEYIEKWVEEELGY